MGLENVTYVADLVSSNPLGSDPKGQGDDHIRNIKKALGNTFPGASRGFILTKAAELSDATTEESASRALVTADHGKFIPVAVAAGSVTLTLPDPTVVGTGWQVGFIRKDGGANTLTIARFGAELINYVASSIRIDIQYESLILRTDGTNWFIVASNQYGESNTKTTGTSTAYAFSAARNIAAAISDGVKLLVDFHVTCGAAPTLNVDSSGAKPLIWADGTAIAAGDIPIGAKVRVVYDGVSWQVLSPTRTLASGASASLLDEDDMASNSATSVASQQSIVAYIAANKPALRGHIDGLILSNNVTDALKDIDIAAGEAADGTATALMVLASALTKKLDASWAVGTDQGALDGTESVAGTPDASTWYHIWLIRRPDTGVVDVLASESATSPTMPTNYTQKRRIGAVLFDATPDILAFFQDGDHFNWDAPTAVNDTTDHSASRQTATLDTPLGIKTKALLRVTTGATTVPHGVLLTPLDIPDVAPATAGAPGVTALGVDNGTTLRGASETVVRTNTSSQIGYRSTGSTVDTTIITYGWIDPRGRNA
jgi:hypothetical protein